MVQSGFVFSTVLFSLIWMIGRHSLDEDEDISAVCFVTSEELPAEVMRY